MAARRKKKASKKKASKRGSRGKSKVVELIISKSRTKGAATQCNVSSEFYGALDDFVRDAIAKAEDRAVMNGRKTLRAQDL